MTAVLQKLSLLAYRGISGLTLDELAPVTLITCANNAGSTSLLEAAGLFLRPLDPAQWASAVRQRDIDMALTDGIWSLFPATEALHPEHGPQQSAPILLEGVSSGVPRRIEAHCLVPRTLGGAEAADLSARIDVSVNAAPPVTLEFPSPATAAHRGPTLSVVTVTPSTHYFTKALAEHLRRVIDEGTKPLAVDLLQLFDPDIKDLGLSASLGRETIRVTHRTRGTVDLASFGDGVRRATAFALALTRAAQGVLLVDEIEAGIHPRLLCPVFGKLLTAAASSAVQLIATTRSLEAIDALLLAAENQSAGASLSAFWIKREKGTHQARRYDLEKLRRLREGGLDIR